MTIKSTPSNFPSYPTGVASTAATPGSHGRGGNKYSQYYTIPFPLRVPCEGGRKSDSIFLNIYFRIHFFPHKPIIMESGFLVRPPCQHKYNSATLEWEPSISFLRKKVSSSHQTTSNGSLDIYRCNISKAI